MGQYNSTIEIFQILVRNGCQSNSGRVNLSLGSFYRQIRMKSLAQSEVFVTFENFISSSIFNKQLGTILTKSWSVVISKGTLPKRSSQVRMPTLQTSILLLQVFLLSNSGDMQMGVPQKVYLMVLVLIDHPKSHNLTRPFINKYNTPWQITFYGFRSRWMIQLQCMQSRALQICWTIFLVIYQGILLFYLMYLQS